MLRGELAPLYLDDPEQYERIGRRFPLGEEATFFETLSARFRAGRRALRVGELGTKVMLGLASEGERARFDDLREFPVQVPESDTGDAAFYVGPAVEQIPILLGTAISGPTATGAGGGAAVGAGVALAAGQAGPQAAAPEELVTVPGAALVGARRGFAAGLAVQGARIEAGNAYAELLGVRDEIAAESGEELPHEAIVGTAALIGGINGLLEAGGAAAVLKSLGVKRLQAALTRRGARELLRDASLRSALIELGKRVALAAGSEGATEAAQESVNIAASSVMVEATTSQKRDVATPENLARVLEAGIQGALAGGGITTVGQVVTTAAQQGAKIARAESSSAALNELVEDARASDLRTSAPEIYRDVVDEAARQGGADRNVYVDAREFVTYFQDQKDADVEALREKAPEIFEQLAPALEVGGELVIPVADYATYFADHHEGLAEVVRQGEDALTPREAAELGPDIEQQIQDAIERERARAQGRAEDTDALSPAEEVEQEFTRELVQSGVMTPDTARAVAVLLRANAERRAEGPAGARAFEQARNVRVEGPIPSEPSTRQPQPTLESALEGALARLESEDARRRITTLLDQIREGREPETRGMRRLPVLTRMKEQGGVDPSSPLASELRAIGVERSGPGSVPGLYRRGGNQSLDAFDFVGDPLFAGIEQEEYGRPAAEAIYELIDRELRGNPARTPEEIDLLEGARAAREELARELEAIGVDIREASNDEIIRRLQEVRPADALSYEQSGSRQRGSIRMDPELRSVVIRLTESADLSTALHELGHLFFALLEQDAQLEGASDQLRSDLQAAREFVGAREGEAITSEQHERFARAWEAYLREGNAPSVEMQSVFQRFRAWLTHVYRSLRGLGVEINDEIRGVFDRLLASEEATQQAMEARGLLPAFESAEAAGMTEAEFADYQRSLERAIASAQENMDREVMRELDRVRSAEYKAARERIQAEVEAEVNARPVFRAKHWLQRGEMLEGELPVSLEPQKLSRDALVDMYGRGILRVLPSGRYGVWQAEGGLHPDVVAEVFGFESGDQLVRALQASGRRPEVIEQETKARLEAEVGDMMRDGSMPERALEASETDETGAFLARELRALGRRAGRPATPAQVARQSAQRIIGETRVRDLRPGRFRAAEIRAARESVKAITAKDWTAAHDAKRRQLLNHYLAREATKAKERADANRAYARRFDLRRTRERIGKAGESYIDQIDAMLDRFDFRRISDKSADRRERLAEWIEKQEREEESTVIIDPRLREEAFRKPWRNLTTDELQAVIDAVKNIEHLARLKRELILGAERRDFESTVEGMVDSILSNSPERPTSEGISPSMRERFKDGVENVHAWHTKMEFLAEKLDGHERQGPVWEGIFKPLADAEARERDMMAEAASRFREVFGRMSKLDRAKLKSSKVHVPEIGKSMTREELISAALNVGNDGNRRALMEGAPTRTREGRAGKGWSEEQLRAVLSHLTREDWQVVQGVWDMIDAYWPQIAELERRVTGVAPQKVQAAPVETPFGTLRGGYYPLRANPGSSFVAYIRNQKGRADQLFENNWSRAATRHGHTIERTTFGGQEVWLSLNVLTEHVYNVVHDITHREAIVNVQKLTSDRRFRGAIESTVGAPVYRLFRPWLQAIAGEVRQHQTPYDQILAHVRSGVTIAYMGVKFTTAFSQIAGVLPSIDRVGLKPMLGAYRDFFTRPDRMRQRLEFAMERSSTLRYRMQSFDREARDLQKSGLLATGPLQRIGQEGQKAFMYLTGLMDMSVSVPTWFAAYESELEATGSESRAISAGDQAVRLTQGTGSVKDLSAVQRGGELQRLFTMFYSYFATFYNQLGNRVSQARIGRISLPQAAASMFWIWFAPALISELLAGRGPEDEEAWWEWAAYELPQYPALGLVGVRDLVGHAVNKLRGRPWDFEVTPISAALAAPINALVSSIQDAAEGELRRSTVRSWFDTLGFWGRLPSRQIWITTEAIYDEMTGQGEVQVPRDLLFTRPQERRARR